MREFIKRLRRDEIFRTRVTLRLSFAWNLFIALYKLFTGLQADSAWLIAFGTYYLALAGLRFSLARSDRRFLTNSDLPAEWRRYRATGVVLLMLDILLTVVVILAADLKNTAAYPGHLIYLMAMYAFYAVVSASIKLRRFRRFDNPILSAIKAVSLTTALTAMFSLEAAMTTRFGEDAHVFRAKMNAATGGTVCVVVLAMAVSMIVQATKKLNRR